MVKQDYVITPPENRQIKIWRYMDFAKFVAMLEYQGLFFSPANRLVDRFEGSYTQANTEEQRRRMKGMGWSEDRTEQALASVSSSRREAPEWMIVNCWHMNEHESTGMWNQYAQTQKSICIQSTYQRLQECLDETGSEVYLGVVKYIDYDSEAMLDNPIFYPFFHKRQQFKDERELRALIWTITEPLPLKFGRWVDVQLDELIERIYIAPSSSSWFRDLVERIARRYDLKKDIVPSSLDKDPLW